MPKGYKTSPVPSKYQPIPDFLAQTTDDAVTLTDKEVAALIGGPLPTSAVLSTSWWSRRRFAHVQAWEALGWRAQGSAANRRVVFTRDAEG